MSLFKGFGNGFGAYGKALTLIFSNGLWWYFLFPLLLNIFLIVASWYGISSLSDYAENWVNDLFKFEDDDFFLAEYLQSSSGYVAVAIGWVVWFISKVLLFVLYGLFGGYIIIMLMSPVFAILSEKAEEILTGNKYPFNGDQLMRDVVRGVVIAFRNMFIEFGYMIVILILSFFIPILGGIIGTVILFFIASYFYGFAFIDYTNERRRLTIKQSVKFIRANKGMAIGNGFIFALAMFIPLCGTTIAGFIAIVSVVAATISTHKIVDLSNNPYAKNKTAEPETEVVDESIKAIEEDTKLIDENTEDIDGKPED
ncbi:MAG: EI24 domain-containing protein [Flavobacteriales bacterium]|nr:EI24 domain-containing protein [Flavobacteriales bacterium]